MQIAGMAIHLRLKEARIRAGFKTAAAAAKHLRIPYGTYSGHESGSRGIKQADIAKYAEKLDVSEAWLTFGDIRKPENKHIALVVPSGHIGETEDGLVKWFSWSKYEGARKEDIDPRIRSQGGSDFIFAQNQMQYSVPAVPMMGEYLSCIIVLGSGVSDVCAHGGVIYFKNEFQHYEENHLNILCIHYFDRDECYLGMLSTQNDGNYILNGSGKSLIFNRAPKYVSPIWAVMTPYARRTVLEEFADGLKQLSKLG